MATAVVTAVSTLAGVWFTQRHSTGLRLLDLREQHRVEQTTALAEVLTTGRVYVDALARAAYAVDTARPWQSEALNRWEASDVAHRRALMPARLIVRDATVFAALTPLSQAQHSRLSKLFVDVMSASHGQPEHADLSPLGGQLVRAANEYGADLDKLEELTRLRILNVDLPHRDTGEPV